MKKVEVKYFKYLDDNLYSSRKIRFAVMCPGINNTIEQFSSWTSCREVMTDEILDYYEELRDQGRRSAFKLCIGVSFDLRELWNTKLPLAGQKRAIETSMKDATRFLNLIELRQGWAQTVVYEGSKQPNDKHHQTYIFRSSVKWARSTQLLSLYLLCIRLGRVDGLLRGIKDLDNISSSTYYKVSDKHCPVISTDIATFNRTAKHWPLLLKHCEELFFRHTIEDNFDESDGYSGISNLFNNAFTYNKRVKEIQGRWQEILKEDKKVKRGINNGKVSKMRKGNKSNNIQT